MDTLLLEIGAEEIPAGYIDPALKALAAILQKKMTEARIEHGSALVFGSPRRLAVRIEKVVELLAETGEEWFDMVRYDWEDGFGSGFQVSDHKATATNTDFFILPYSNLTLEAGGNVEVQNPGYN